MVDQVLRRLAQREGATELVAEQAEAPVQAPVEAPVALTDTDQKILIALAAQPLGRSPL